VKVSPEITHQLAARGVRLTKQREEVFGMLLQKRDHPTAAELFLRAKKHMPSISLATIYNCLDALVDCDLVKQVHVDRAATRYCANLKEHSHFYCESCGAIADVEKPSGSAWNLPFGYVVSQADVSLRGLCPKCSAKNEASETAKNSNRELKSETENRNEFNRH
jgi:Fe2+ or Zn2+ uptake regulation protein